MIEIKRVSKVYRLKDREVVAVDDVSLTIEDGDIYGIIGYSGAGKSTLVRLINQLEVQDSGKIFIDGQDLGNLSQIELRKLRTKVGMIFQHFNLLWSRTVSENIELALEIAGNKDKRIRQQKVQELVELVGLTGRENAYPSELWLSPEPLSIIRRFSSPMSPLAHWTAAPASRSWSSSRNSMMKVLRSL